MKRTILLSLLLCVLLALAACDSKAPADTTAADTAAPTEAPTEAPDETPTEAPADAPVDDETETSPDETETEPETEPETEFTPAEPVPEDVAAVGLPLDGSSYTLGGESAYDVKEQYACLSLYAHCYADKTFILCGNLVETADGYLVLSLGEDMEIPVYFESADAPTVGSYVQLTAT